MSRNTWDIYTYNTSTSSWDSDGTIYRPNESMTIDVISTHQRAMMADGSNARIAPETRSNTDPLTLRWLEIDFDDGLKAKIKGYVDAFTKVKIVTHESEELIGYFQYIRRIWLVGVDDTEDLEAVLDRES